MYIYIELGYKLRVQVEKEFEIGGTRDDRSTRMLSMDKDKTLRDC